MVKHETPGVHHIRWWVSSPPDMVTFIFQDARGVGFVFTPDMVTFIFQDARNVGFVFTTWYGHLYFSGCTKRGVCLHHLIWSPLFFRMHETWGLSSPPDMVTFIFQDARNVGFVFNLIWSPLFFRMHETRGLSSPPDMVTFIFQDALKRGVCLHHLIWSPLFFRMHEGLSSPPDMVTFIFQDARDLHHLYGHPLFFRMHETGVSSPPDQVTFIFQDALNEGFVFTTWYGHLYFSGCTKRGLSSPPDMVTFIFQDARNVGFVFATWYGDHYFPGCTKTNPTSSCTWYGHLYFSGCTKRGVCLHHLIWWPLFFRMHETWGLSSPPDMVTFIFQDARNVGFVFTTWYGHLYFSGCTKRGVCLRHLIWSPLFSRMHETRGLSSPPDMVTFIFQDARDVQFVFTTWYGHLYFSGCTKRGVCLHHLIWSPLFFRMHETWGLSSPPDMVTFIFSGCTKRGVCRHHPEK